MVKPYKRFQSQGQVVFLKGYRCSKLNAGCLLSCRDNPALNVCLCRLPMTLHQGQGHRHEHEQICHAQVYRHARFECHSFNTVRNMIIIVPS